MHPATQYRHEPPWCRLWVHASRRRRHGDTGILDPSQRRKLAAVVLLQSSRVRALLDPSRPSFRMPCTIFIESICLVVLTNSLHLRHCNAGMVFAINAPTTGAKTFAAFLANAATATHPDPALHQTAPFTPTTSNTTTSTADPSADVTYSSDIAGDQTATASGATTSTTPASGAVKIEGRVAVVVGLIGMAMGSFVL